MPKVQLNMRVDTEFKARLEKAAETQHRSVSNLIEWVMTQYLDQHHPEIKLSEAKSHASTQWSGEHKFALSSNINDLSNFEGLTEAQERLVLELIKAAML